jgi:hypothetical protein
MIKSFSKKLYKHISTWFGCSLTIVIDQGTHLINGVIRYLINHFMLKHINYIIIIPKVMVKLTPQTRSLKPCSLKWLMKIGMTKMRTCAQYIFHIRLHTRLVLITHFFRLFIMDYIHYC